MEGSKEICDRIIDIDIEYYQQTHNLSANTNNFTSRYNPWEFAHTFVCVFNSPYEETIYYYSDKYLFIKGSHTK